MSDVQNGYPSTLARAFAGQVANSLTYDVVSRENEAANVAFGAALIQGAADEGVTVGAGGVFVGFAIRNPALPPQNGDKYQIGDTVQVLSRGTIWVTTLKASAPGGAVYRTAAGAISADAVGNTVIDGARFELTAADGGLTRVALH